MVRKWLHCDLVVDVFNEVVFDFLLSESFDVFFGGYLLLD